MIKLSFLNLISTDPSRGARLNAQTQSQHYVANQNFIPMHGFGSPSSQETSTESSPDSIFGIAERTIGDLDL